MNASLTYDDDRSHKFWRATVDGATLTTEWGRIGTRGQSKTATFDTPTAAETAAARAIAEKRGKGYVDAGSPAAVVQRQPAASTPVGDFERLRPVLYEERDLSTDAFYVTGDQWVAEEKWNGIRCLVKVNDGAVTFHTRNGKELERRAGFAALRTEFARLPAGLFALDGEYMDDGRLRLFDLPCAGTLVGRDSTFDDRRLALEALADLMGWTGDPVGVVDQYRGAAAKRALIDAVVEHDVEGIVVKRLDGLYSWWGSARSDVAFKAKNWRTADLEVTAVGIDGKGNCAVAAYRDGVLVEVGHVSQRPRVPIRVGDVVEVKYLYVGAGDRLVQPALLRSRPDKPAVECGYDQLTRCVPLPRLYTVAA